MPPDAGKPPFRQSHGSGQFFLFIHKAGKYLCRQAATGHPRHGRAVIIADPNATTKAPE